MRSLARLLLAAALGAIPIGVAMMSCGTDAAGVDACRQIEAARCSVAPTCSPGFDVSGCTRFYRDECLVGIGNADAGDVTMLIQPCVAAIDACADAGGEAGCPGQALQPDASCVVDGGDLPLTPCNIIMHCPEVLAACHFVAVVPPAVDAGHDTGTVDTADAGDGGDTADAGDAGDSGDAGDAGVQ